MILNRPKEYKNKEKWRKTKREQQRRDYGSRAFAPRHHEIWSEGEKEMVWAHEISDAKLSAIIGRSIGAIQMMRCKMRKELSAD